MKNLFNPKLEVPTLLLLACFNSTAWAENSTEELKRKSTEKGQLTTISSKTTDPIGAEGLWGLRGNFIVSTDCKNSFKALKNIEKYPEHSDKVKKVKVLEKKENAILTDYTEGAYGFETTTRLQWTFSPDKAIPSITSKSVGEKDPPSWLKMSFEEVGHPNYCKIDLEMFADMSYVPKFVMNWMGSMAAEELVNTYRSIINGQNDNKK